ncbi:S1 family peptidase [Streptoalloteichus hindustanus]|uniref:Trypsin n=1 Tax=Streptoalloteichus hindustanus TaxID=2017 RepID=A0A1M5IVZ1_STRHI|nr:serine protease [Streptoalloteichus hindustanus]SHG32315.1 Trypsin [Streptoalloteichus hindustanus]
MPTRSVFITVITVITAALSLVLAPAAVASSPPDPAEQPYVIGGRNATETYSFSASLQFRTDNRHQCGASLVKSRWLVTAAHCVVGRTANEFKVRVGSNDRNAGGSVANVSRIVVHPRYAVQRPFGDIALLELATPVSQAPVPIPLTPGLAGTPTRIMGWGTTCPAQSCPTVTQKELDTSILAVQRCTRIDGVTEICTNNPNNNSGACYGDSGGPQVRRIDNRWYLIGATSRSGNNDPTCATGPSIYTSVVAYRSWIQQHVGVL